MKDSLNKCLVFNKSKTTTLDVIGYLDSDYGGDHDCQHSISDYIFNLFADAISWK